MRSFAIPAPHVKSFMSKLLKEPIFDDFATRNAELTLAVHIVIDGKVPGEEKKYTSWADLRPLVYDLIRRDVIKPQLMKFVFSHAQPIAVHPNAAALFINFAYEKNAITLTTATAQREFALDKTLDTDWIAWVESFFAQMNIPLAPHIPQYQDDTE
ncbi:MAG: DUF5721 family protein [Defluviitaleaceae bacterium]|nr:DUF5721 family protein [Defluviitaleaceae bacterium]